MRQPRLVLIAGAKLRSNGVCRRGTGRSWRQADRRMNARRRRPKLGPRSRGRQTSELERRSVGASAEPRRVKMRAVFVAALVAAGIGLTGLSPTLAAPASGNAIGN